MRVPIIDQRTGRTREVSRRDARVLTLVRPARFAYATRDMQAAEAPAVVQIVTSAPPVIQVATPAAAVAAPQKSGDAPTFDITEEALKIAQEHGVDLAKVTGTGKDGRILKGDVLAKVQA
jgi:2-oxoglutarate dehydrogenase E2 component (dihydrolipoamide succinyltransferase)